MANGGNIKFSMITDVNKAERDYVRMQNSNRKLTSEVRKLKEEIRGMGRTSNKAFDSMRRDAASLIKSYFGVQGLIQGVEAYNSLLRERARLQAVAEKESRSVGQIKSSIIASVGNTASDREIQQFFERISSLNDAGGPMRRVSDRDLFSAADRLLSATSGTLGDSEGQITSFLKGADALAFDPELIGEVGSAVLSLTANFTEANEDVIKSLTSFSLELKRQARFEELGGLREFQKVAAAASVADTDDDLVTGSARTRRQSETIRNVAGLFAALGQRAGDIEGAETATLVSQLVTGLGEVLPSRDIVDAGGRVRRRARFTASGDVIDNVRERLEAITRDGAFDAEGRFIDAEQLQREFFVGRKGLPKAAKARAKLIGILRELIGQGTVFDTFGAARGALSDPATAGSATLDQVIRRQGAGSFDSDVQNLALVQRGEVLAKENLQLSASIGSIRRSLFDPEFGVFPKEGLFGNFFQRDRFDSQVRTTEEAARFAIGELQLAKLNEGDIFSPGFDSIPAKRVEQIDNMISLLQKILDSQTKSNRTVEGAAAGAANAQQGQRESR